MKQYRASETDSVYDPNFREGFHQSFAGMCLSGIQELALDFRVLETEALICTRHSQIVRYMVQYFKSLNKLSIVLGGGIGPMHLASMIEGGRKCREAENVSYWIEDTEGKYPTHDANQHWPDERTQKFEAMEVSIIQQGLGLNPKLPSIRPVSFIDNAREIAYGSEGCFLPHVYTPRIGPLPPPITDTWFWEAEQGDTLVWNNERVVEDWRGVIYRSDETSEGGGRA